MHYFIFPTKDATIYSGSVEMGSVEKTEIDRLVKLGNLVIESA